MTMTTRIASRLFLLCLCLIMLSACAGKQRGGVTGDSSIADERNFPQDLLFYAKQAGPDKRLMDATDQALMDAKFNARFFSPWDLSKTTLRKKEVGVIFKKARGYRRGSERWTQADWAAIAANANMATFPNNAQPAITVRYTDLREMPTHEARFSKPTPDPKAYPFDDTQYSLLPVGTPLFIAHTSRDGRWYFVESAAAGGWVDAKDVALVDSGFAREWRTSAQAALVQDNVPLAGTDVTANVGTILPLTEQDGTSVAMKVPFKGADGWATAVTASVPAAAAVQKPLPLTPGNVARVGNVMMGQHYGWGGMFGLRDCSALTREIMTPFGVWLPRNSRGQGRTGILHPLEGMDAAGKDAMVLREGVPFLSLVTMRGHVTMYVGQYKNRPAIFHNVWGVRVYDGNNDNGRHVIGKAVVTSLTPGAELPNLYRTTTFVDRLHTLSTPAVQ